MIILNNVKVFGIGFHKTGTTSLNRALNLLGYNVTGPNGVMDENISSNVYDMCLEIAKKHDAFLDNPWPIVFKEMDINFPNSKFILTIRDVDEWYDSVLNHFYKERTPMRKWIYGKGSPYGNETLYKDRFVRHYNEVRNYFSNRSDDLLEFNLVKGDGYKKLCDFLGKNNIEETFPHLNKGKY